MRIVRTENRRCVDAMDMEIVVVYRVGYEEMAAAPAYSIPVPDPRPSMRALLPSYQDRGRTLEHVRR